MKTLRPKLFAVFAFMGLALAPLVPATAQAGPTDDMRGEWTAIATRQSASYEAWAEAWLQVAKCLSDAETTFAECTAEALVELDQTLAQAYEQYEARMELCRDLGGGPHDPELDPSEFSADVDSNYLPFVPGRTLVYEKQTEDGLERVEVTTLDETVEIEGFECRIVNDVETLEGEVQEDTVDWFTQHVSGDVWYFGEISRNFEDGFLDNLDGSWRTGKDGAKPGILMLGVPVIGAIYRQEFLANEAEDVARVLSVGETVTVPAGTFSDCVMTEEWTPLEPGDSLEYKYYAPGIGMVLEVDPASGERLGLVEIIN